MIRKVLKKLLLTILIIFVIAQFFGPEKNDGDMTSVVPFIEETQPPADVKVILENACFDCHSNHTRYPWYNKITPVNYWLADHVRHGKGDFNVSEWNDYSIKKKDHKFEELIEEVKEREMPLPSYTWVHGDANLSQEQIETIVTWAKTVRTNYALQLKQAE